MYQSMRYNDPETPFSILVAAKNPDLRTSIVKMFDAPDYRVVCASDGKDAFDKAKAQLFDLVVTGIVMAKLDGIELLNALRQLYPRLPIIMVGEGSGEIENVYLRCAALMGAARTYQHPLDPLTFQRNARAVMLQNRLLTRQKV